MQRREGARHDRRDRNPIQNEAAAVIHEALALHQHHQLAWDAETTRDRGRRQRIRGRDDRSQNERARPRQAVDKRMSDNGHADGCHTDKSDRQQADRPNVRTQVTKRGEEGRAVEQGRKDAEEDELRLELELGHPRDEPDRQPTKYQQDRVRDPQRRRSRQHRRHNDDQRQRDNPILNIEMHPGIVPAGTPGRVETPSDRRANIEERSSPPCQIQVRSHRPTVTTVRLA